MPHLFFMHITSKGLFAFSFPKHAIFIPTKKHRLAPRTARFHDRISSLDRRVLIAYTSYIAIVYLCRILGHYDPCLLQQRSGFFFVPIKSSRISSAADSAKLYAPFVSINSGRLCRMLYSVCSVSVSSSVLAVE